MCARYRMFSWKIIKWWSSACVHTFRRWRWHRQYIYYTHTYTRSSNEVLWWLHDIGMIVIDKMIILCSAQYNVRQQTHTDTDTQQHIERRKMRMKTNHQIWPLICPATNTHETHRNDMHNTYIEWKRHDKESNKQTNEKSISKPNEFDWVWWVHSFVAFVE